VKLVNSDDTDTEVREPEAVYLRLSQYSSAASFYAPKQAIMILLASALFPC